MFPVTGLSSHATLAPEGKFRTENCLIPAGATVTVAGLMLVGDAGEAVSVKLAVPMTAWVAEFFAVTVTVSFEVTLFGAP